MQNVVVGQDTVNRDDVTCAGAPAFFQAAPRNRSAPFGSMATQNVAEAHDTEVGSPTPVGRAIRVHVLFDTA